MTRGKLVVVVMFVTAIGMGGYAWWHQYQGGRRCAEFWGTRAMVIVRYAPRTEFFSLIPIDKATNQDAASKRPTPTISTQATAPPVVIDGQQYISMNYKHISAAPGLVHARHVLVDDSSFVWNSSPDECQPQWEFLLRFTDDAGQVTVVFDTQCGWIQWHEENRRVRLIPSLAEAFRKKQSDWGK
jgi:hypothetical protein